MPANRLIAWAASNGRDLPWRHTRDPWAILVSEVMLQQTQVARVIPVWRAFLECFPTAKECAAARQAEVVTAWRGMGYNRRAVNLHRCAIAIADEHGGVVPNDPDALLTLPGIGPYTARAVLAFAFEQRVGVLDVNAARVHARLNGRAVDQREADSAAPRTNPWAWNQAILDLGATVCTNGTRRVTPARWHAIACGAAWVPTPRGQAAGSHVSKVPIGRERGGWSTRCGRARSPAGQVTWR